MTITPEHQATRAPQAAMPGRRRGEPAGPGRFVSAWRALPTPLRYVVESLAIFLVYNLLGEINRQFTPPPSGISPIWLPAGFAVGVVLVRGWWTTIPLLLTGFVNTVRADWYLTDPVSQGGSGLDPSTILWAGTLYGLAIISHCVVAKLLVDRIPDRTFEGLFPALAFLLAVGPVSCVFSALLGTEVFRVEGFVTTETFAVSSFTFWIGDTIACMLIAPVIVALFGGIPWHGRRLAIGALAVVTAAIVLASTGLMGRTELDRIRQTFDRSATRAATGFETPVRRLEGHAIDQASLVAAAPELSTDEFDAAAEDRLDRADGAQVVTWLEVPGGELDATRVATVAGPAEAAADVRDSFVVDPIIPRLRLARDFAQPTWVVRADDEGANHDFVYAPIFAETVDGETLGLSARREQLTGFVGIRTDLDDVLETSLDLLADVESSAVVSAQRGDGEPVLVAAAPAESTNLLVDDDLSPLASARTKGVPFATDRELELDDAQWTVTFAPSRTYVTDKAFLVTVVPGALIAMAFALTIMLLALTSTGQRARLGRLVRMRTRALQASEYRYRSVVDNVREAIFQLDAAGRVTFVSAAWNDDMSVGGRDGVYGVLLVDALRVADRTRLQHLLDQARARAGETFSAEFESTDQQRVLEVRIATPQHDAADDDDFEQSSGYVGVVVDVTSQREVLRNRERFVSLVAHELRNPLTVISGSVATIGAHEGEQLPPLSAKLLPTVLTAAHRLDRIISDLLVSSQVDAGTLTLHPTRADLRRVVADAIDVARTNATEHGVELVADGLDAELSLTCDVDRVGQVVDNLLSNAIKYTPGGGSVTVSVDASDDGRSALVVVRDTGIGIARDDHARVFERYGRTEQGTIVAAGTGLGLSICRSIAESHGGTIELESELGIGSTFTLVLPIT